MGTDDILDAIGATGEIAGGLMSAFLANGFSRAESMRLVEAYITATFTPLNKEEN